MDLPDAILDTEQVMDSIFIYLPELGDQYEKTEADLFELKNSGMGLFGKNNPGDQD
jgi:hypothetical protein